MGIEPIWFEISNSLPYFVKKACQFFNCLRLFALSTNLFDNLKLRSTYERRNRQGICSSFGADI
jgi:hypothetical protein